MPQILCEIKYGNFRRYKTAILVISEVPNFDFWENSTFENVRNTIIFTTRRLDFNWNQIWKIYEVKIAILVILKDLNIDFWEKFTFWQSEGLYNAQHLVSLFCKNYFFFLFEKIYCLTFFKGKWHSGWDDAINDYCSKEDLQELLWLEWSWWPPIGRWGKFEGSSTPHHYMIWNREKSIEHDTWKKKDFFKKMCHTPYLNQSV